MVAKRSDYTSDAVEAARSVLLELTRLLGEYQKGIVIVGGWVPELLFSQASRRHIGSLDVDLWYFSTFFLAQSCGAFFPRLNCGSKAIFCDILISHGYMNV